MGAPKRYPPNRRLTWERLQRGWSHDEVVRQIQRSMELHGDAESGLIPSTVRRWETGARWPEARFRKHLVLIFGKKASDLGLLTADELAVQPPADQALDLARKLLTLATSDDEQGVDRKSFLRGLIGAGLAPLIAQLGSSAESIDILDRAAGGRTGSPDPRTAEAYGAITTQQRELYWVASAAELLGPVVSHTRLGTQLLRNTTRDHDRRHLAASVAESALLSARLAFFDLRQPELAEQFFATAREAAEQADDHALAAAIYAHMSFVPAFDVEPNRSVAFGYLDAAQSHARYAPGPALRSWLHCVAAEVAARTGAPDLSLKCVRQAEDSLSTGGTDPVWLDFYDSSRLAGFAGQAQLLAGRYATAATSLEQALANLDSRASKQRAVILFDLATAHAAEDPERAASDVQQALDALETDWYATAFERIPQVAAALTGTPYIADLTDRVKALPSAELG